MGPQGNPGFRGDTGYTGIQGLLGPSGNQGPTGPAGASPWLLNGTNTYYNGQVQIYNNNATTTSLLVDPGATANATNVNGVFKTELYGSNLLVYAVPSTLVSPNIRSTVLYNSGSPDMVINNNLNLNGYNLYANNIISRNYSNTTYGYTQITPSGSTNPGQIQFFSGSTATSTAGVIGYIGSTDGQGNIQLNVINGYTGWSSNGNFTASGTIYSGSTSTTTGLLMQGTSTASYIRALSGTLYLGYGSTNNVLINSSGLTVTGTVNATSFNSGSDYRIKEDVVTLDDSFTVDKLRPVTYNNTKLGKQDIGLIAHELQEVYPFLVNGEKDGEEMQSVNYSGLIGILIKEIQELKKEVKMLKENLTPLKI